MSSTNPVGVVVSFLLVLLLLCLCPSLSFGKHINNYHNTSCKPTEKRALLQFKQGLRDPRGRLISWEGDDCCKWRGVHCAPSTGNIVKLSLYCNDCDLHPPSLQGEFGSSLLRLECLEHLDVSGNDFMGSHIPNSIDSLTKLKHLDLSNANFSGSVPSQLGKLTNLVYLNISCFYGVSCVETDNLWLSNLTSLKFLDLSHTTFPRAVPVELGNLTSLRHLDLSSSYCTAGTITWISRLTQLRHFDMSWCKFEDNTTSVLQELNMLPFISEVYLRGALFSSSLHGHINFTFLVTLDFSSNDFVSVPYWLANITSLQHLIGQDNPMKQGIFTVLGRLCNLNTLDMSFNQFTENLSTSNTNLSHCASCELEMLDLSFNNFTGFLSDWLAQCQKLKYLALNNNKLYGNVPEFLGSLTSLQTLWLSKNNLSGNIPLAIFQLKQLSILRIGGNHLQGNLSEMHFSNLTYLTTLDLSSNSFELTLSSSWVPPFHLISLNLESCKMGPHFPMWLQTQNTLSQFSVANTGISDALPVWIWNFSINLQRADLADNNIFGFIPDQLSPDSSLDYVNLSSNGFKSLLPRFQSQTLMMLDLSNNSFYGPISQIMPWVRLPSMAFLSLSSNHLSGIIPSNICKWRNLDFLDISANYLTGVLPDCLKTLHVLNLAGNHLNGIGFTSNISPCFLQSLHLNNNNLQGGFPLSLQSCKYITVLDLGENTFDGVIPDWLPSSLPHLRVLRLRENQLSGNIPSNLPHMSSLQVLDLANNNLCGNIPKTFGEFSSMKYDHTLGDAFPAFETSSAVFDYSFSDFIALNIKKQTMIFNHLLPLVASIDLSDNMLSSDIPTELGNLTSLINLDLSQNSLTGRIPKEFSELHQLESLDLSNNKLSGEIPTVLSTLTFLVYLNLSFNNLSGIIPIGTQFSTMDYTSYLGNPYLCGYPLKQCHQESNRTVIVNRERGEKQQINEYEKYETRWLMVGMVFGFILGVWVFYGSLMLFKSWRYAYCEVINAWCNHIHEMIR